MKVAGEGIGARPRGPALRWFVVLGLTVGAVAACDSPPPREARPLAVIATSSVRPDEDCLLNYDELGAGRHTVEVISEQAPARVRIVDEAGATVFEGSGDPEDMQDMPVPAVVELAAGTYTVECTPEGAAASSAELRVLPARPGYEDLDPQM